MSIPDFVRLRGLVNDGGRGRKKLKDVDRNICVKNFDLYVGQGKKLLQDAEINIVYGKKHAIIGKNGLGKSVLLKAIVSRQPPFSNIPSWYSIVHLEQDVIADDRTPLEIVLSSDLERLWLLEHIQLLEKEEEQEDENGEQQEQRNEEYNLKDLYERFREIDGFSAEGRVLAILKGLQFTDEMLNQSSKCFSGGWRMRIALARILFMTPDLAILDEPTNHLDLHATIWLEKYLSQYKKTVLLVSHDETILNECVDTIIHFSNFSLKTYNGNYYHFLKVKAENERVVLNNKRKEKSKNKDKNKDKSKNKDKKVFFDEKVATFVFPEVKYFKDTAVIKFENVSFSYEENKILKNLTFGVYLDTRIGLVGKNASGKSTIMKLLNGELEPTSGEIVRNSALKIVKYAQHSEDALNLEMTPIEYLRSIIDLSDKECLKVLGSFGLSGKYAQNQISTLSGGQKVRLIFASLTIQNPHLILLDEPTNHLDIETIKSLEQGLKQYQGGLVIISHNQSILNNCCNVIWIVENKTVRPFDGTFEDYKSDVLEK